MASKAMWEVDPETRSKLQEIQKANSNDRCVDCNAPAPQWASPKFGVFICLSCAGVHRGLGVHISFVRSITMDAFKAAEIERMRLGGNKPWKDFFDNAEENKLAGVTFEDSTIAERYGGSAGEEWKERLTAKVEGKEYVPGATPAVKPAPTAAPAKTALSNASGGTLQGSRSNSRSSTPSGPRGSRTESPARIGLGESRKAKVDDKYFAKLGADNASRPADLPPSQGGKYAGFGSSGPSQPARDEKLPNLDELQKDPVAAISKGWGWFAGAVGKTAKNVNDSYIQPTAQRLAEADIAAQARVAAGQVSRTAQMGAKNINDSFSRFVEGEGSTTGGRRIQTPLDESKKDFWDSFGDASPSSGGRNAQAPLDETKKDFWDSFGAPTERTLSGGTASAAKSSASAIGTKAMGGGGSGGVAGGANKKDDDWEKW